MSGAWPVSEALVVAPDEVLVIRVEADMAESGNIEQMQEFLNDGPLKGRYVVFVGEVEFAKVKL